MNKLIIANWKMKLSTKESLLLAKKFKASAIKIAKNKKLKSEIIICPDYLSLLSLTSLFKKSPLNLGAQDCAIATRGADTGEISPVDLKTLGVKYVIIGHSERREKLGETSELINKKIKAALENKLIPILCIGEKSTDKKAGRTKMVLTNQLRDALRNVKIQKASNLVVAYEPLWAISPGKAIIPTEAEAINTFVSEETEKILKKNIRVLYGGSVDHKNAPAFLQQKHIAGFLVGAASLKENFSNLWF